MCNSDCSARTDKITERTTVFYGKTTIYMNSEFADLENNLLLDKY